MWRQHAQKRQTNTTWHAIKALVPEEGQDVIGSTTVRRSIMSRTAAWGIATPCLMSRQSTTS
jgi:hypothetical protein